jgi:hypothetical protein
MYLEDALLEVRTHVLAICLKRQPEPALDRSLEPLLEPIRRLRPLLGLVACSHYDERVVGDLDVKLLVQARLDPRRRGASERSGPGWRPRACLRLMTRVGDAAR